MLKQFGLQENWDTIRVLRCTRQHSVLLLKNKVTGMPEVVKVISKRTFNNTVYQELFHLSDKHLVPITNIQTYRDWKIIFSPRLIPLTEYIREEGISLPEIYRLIEQISTALSALHEKNLLHLDITPDNIFLNEEGNFFLGDFCHVRQIKHTATLTSITSGYAAPEYMDKHITTAADQYSFAVLLFALLHNGSVPEFGHKNLINLFSGKQSLSSRYGVSYPEALYHCLKKALSPSPSDRYDSVSLFASQLRDCLSPICRENTYRLQVSNCNDAFLETHTQLISLQKKTALKMLPKTIIAVVLVSLLSGLAWKALSDKQSKTNYTPSVPVSTNKTLADTAIPAPSGNLLAGTATPIPTTYFLSNILDISNRNADTMAELFDESLSTNDWNIVYGENNRFSSLDELAAFSNIRELYLSGNRIHRLDAIASLKHLETAILSDNLCTDVQTLCSLTNLSILDLSGNRELSEVACLETLTNLQLLILTDTSVSDSTIDSLQTALPNCEIVY